MAIIILLTCNQTIKQLFKKPNIMTIRETINNLDTMAGELIDEIDEGHSENDIYYELREVLDDLQDKITSAQQDNGWI